MVRQIEAHKRRNRFFKGVESVDPQRATQGVPPGMNAALYAHVNKCEWRLKEASLYHPFGEPRALSIIKVMSPEIEFVIRDDGFQFRYVGFILCSRMLEFLYRTPLLLYQILIPSYRSPVFFHLVLKLPHRGLILILLFQELKEISRFHNLKSKPAQHRTEKSFARGDC